MATAADPRLEEGQVYRTRELQRWGENPSRLAKRLVREEVLVPLSHGLYYCPKRGRFGVSPPSDDAVMRVFLGGSPFVFTGSDQWNALGLGSTAVFAVPLVYNTKRSGSFTFGGRTFELRRVAFPSNPPREWFVVDLFENAARAGVSREQLASALTRALGRGLFDSARLREMARNYGTMATQALIESAIRTASS
ncbi:hypothetical protein [Melittangium boletus]|uniref:Transcriptional regulator, AbiEi antitoxin, Type IV TA system n=1 Tax=Melittangium boletus DSM 14713 TaxID=1294270 RepID=A0A250ICX5_9BACT|nr:hypothetical protein [Melittangium boletus]ATB29699.1 hypothetical protein MEBOL_003154 [Melittangium boletus DSM 14713]